MARFSTGGEGQPDSSRGHAAATADDPVLCESHAPGHLMHYVHQGRALRSPSERARHVFIDGYDLRISLEDGSVLRWFHHEPARLRSVLSLFPRSQVVYRDFHALRVGPYWFNCAEADFVPCGFDPDAPPAP